MEGRVGEPYLGSCSTRDVYYRICGDVFCRTIGIVSERLVGARVPFVGYVCRLMASGAITIGGIQ
jgi:hypothetical protein